MDAAIEWIRGHKAAFFALTAAVMLAVTVALPAIGGQGRAGGEPDREGAPEGGAATEQEEPPAQEGDGSGAGDGLGAEQRAVLDVLEGVVWVGADGRGRLEVRDGELVETLPDGEGGSDEARCPFRIGEVDGSPILSTEGIGQTDFVLYDGSGTPHVAHLVETDPTVAGEPGDPYWRFSCDALAKQGHYTNLGAAADLSFEGVDGALVDAMGGDAGAIEGALSGYVSVYHATAFLCTWDGLLRLDYEGRTAEADFTLTSNDRGEQNPVRVTLTRNMDTGEFQEADAS